MRQERIIISEKDKWKYPNASASVTDANGSIDNTKREVTVVYDDSGNIMEEYTYSKRYRDELKRSRTPAKSKSSKPSKPSKSRKSGKGPFGLSWANPLSWILWIILLPFKLLWVIIKLALTFLTLGAISKYLKGE